MTAKFDIQIVERLLQHLKLTYVTGDAGKHTKDRYCQIGIFDATTSSDIPATIKGTAKDGVDIETSCHKSFTTTQLRNLLKTRKPTEKRSQYLTKVGV